MRKAYGIVRVSRRAGREGESFVSPSDQAKRIEEACQRDGLDLVKIAEEIDVSGGTPLEDRPGLREAVEAVEAGRVQVVVVAYFDRLVRSLRVQAEVLDRVEGAGGQVLAVDVGAVSQATASKWLSGSMLGLVAEYHRRASAERSAEAQATAVARGVAPFPHVPPGYLRGDDGRLVPDPETAPHVARAFQLRADGATVDQVRAYLRSQGIDRSFHAVQEYLGSRVVLGEIHFGKLVNRQAHQPIVDRAVWDRVQGMRSLRGRRAKSKRLLARLGVLRCSTCGARMVVGTRSPDVNSMYRCPPTGDCDRKVSINANRVEAAVVDVVKGALASLSGRASVESDAREAEQALADAQADLDAAIRAFSGLEGEVAAQERLAELRDRRDQAQERADELGGAAAAVTVSPDDWDRLTLDEQRGLIRAVVKRVVVAPGRLPAADRLTFELFVQDAPGGAVQDALGLDARAVGQNGHRRNAGSTDASSTPRRSRSAR